MCGQSKGYLDVLVDVPQVFSVIGLLYVLGQHLAREERVNVLFVAGLVEFVARQQNDALAAVLKVSESLEPTPAQVESSPLNFLERVAVLLLNDEALS